MAVPTSPASSVALPAWFGDHMVLQTNSEYGARAFLHGTAAPGETVSVDFHPEASHFGSAYTTTADADGTWDVQLYPSSDFTSAFNITVRGSGDAPAARRPRPRRMSNTGTFFLLGPVQHGLSAQERLQRHGRGGHAGRHLPAHAVLPDRARLRRGAAERPPALARRGRAAARRTRRSATAGSRRPRPRRTTPPTCSTSAPCAL